ncbi:uncharacterized protein [Miscanthus floridulus]|uniref:uncharacterized protein n=1 Tax=Miscanthus floridulus TaxID=154761 RepID=UPI00345AFC35
MDGSPPPEQRRSNGAPCSSGRSVGSSHGSPAFYNGFLARLHDPTDRQDASPNLLYKNAPRCPRCIPTPISRIHFHFHPDQSSLPSPPLPQISPATATATATATAMHFRVASIKDVERLIRKRGNEEEVEVRVSKSIKGVSQARRMRVLLRRQMRERAWCVGGISTLRPLVPIANKTQQALVVLRKLDGITTRAADAAVADTEAAKLQADAVREAEKLSEIGYRLSRSPIVPVRQLGDVLLYLGEDVQESNMQAVTFRGRIRMARSHCRDTHSQSIQTIHAAF